MAKFEPKQEKHCFSLMQYACKHDAMNSRSNQISDPDLTLIEAENWVLGKFDTTHFASGT